MTTSADAKYIPESREGMLKITEIFHSLQGEALDAGKPTVFIRLTGCPLRCQYCDTEYAFHGGELHTIEDILRGTARFDARYVCVTGGEPLAQPGCLKLLQELCDAGYSVSLETSGAMDIGQVDARVNRVVDIKTPGSREEKRNRLGNLELLTPNDQVKFVICHREDYEFAKRFILEHELVNKCPVLFSPSHEQMPARELAEWILDDHLPVRFQLQLHKLIWGNVPGR